MYTYGIEICTLFSIKIKFSVAFKHKPLRGDNLSTKDKRPNPKVSSLRRFHCIYYYIQLYLFLFHYEYSYMKELMRDNLCIAKRFSDTVRYIDDFLTLNNNSFEEEIINIYPPELILKRTTESNSRISYLDISISICVAIFLQNLHMECMCHSSSGLVGYVIIM